MLNLLNDIARDQVRAKLNGSSENSRTLNEDTGAFNFHLNHPFQANVSKQMDIHYVNCMQREYGRRRCISLCLGWTSIFLYAYGYITYYNVLQHLGANFNIAFIQYSYRIARVREEGEEGRGEHLSSSSGWENELPNSYVSCLASIFAQT